MLPLFILIYFERRSTTTSPLLICSKINAFSVPSWNVFWLDIFCVMSTQKTLQASTHESHSSFCCSLSAEFSITAYSYTSNLAARSESGLAKT